MSQFPPPGFIPTESAVSGIELYMPAPQELPHQPDVLDFKCPQCQATTAYSISDGGLKCAHCGYYEPPSKPVVGKGAEEFEFTVETLEAAVYAHGWGEARKELQCQSCGSRTTLPEGHLTHTCPFCASNRVLQQDAPQDSLRPRFLIPFQVEANECTTLAHAWLGSSWMTPQALKEMAQVAGFNSIYVPFWTLDASAKADWKAEVGHQQTHHYYSNGKRRTRTVTVWRWESGHVQQTFDDELVPGTARLSNVLMSRVKNYDTKQLVEYDPKFLAGFMAQSYDVQLPAAWEIGRREMREQTKVACHRQATTSQIRNFSMTLDFSNESWRYVLLPLYLSVYKYEDNTYQVMINGQTGQIAGQRPVDWTKVWLAIAAMMTPGLLLGLLGLPALILGPLGVVLIGFAALALIIGLVFAAATYNKAKEMGDV